MKKNYLLLLFYVLPILSFGQQDHMWYFGDKGGLDFNSGTPQVITDGQLYANEGCSAVSDLSGALLFYTNGVTVWNRDHQVMENGNGLLGGLSSSQSAIIVQKPGQFHIYYIFTAAAAAGAGGITYSEVDMTAAAGLGAIVTKNIPLVTPACEKLTAGVHPNGQDVWVIAHGWQNNAFYSYHISSQGINTEPVASLSGDVLAPAGGFHQPYKGCMKLSPNGSRLAVANFGLSLQLFDFDGQTGIVGNPVTMANNWAAPSFYGVEFSPSGNNLYVSMRYTVRQYNLQTANTTAAITDFIGAEAQYGTLQMGPDHKIYVANHFVSVINNPEGIGNECDYDMFGIDVGGDQGHSAKMSLPFFITLPNALDISYSGDCTGSAVAFSLLSSQTQDSAIWNFGDGTTANGTQVAHVFSQAGTYTVKVTATRGGIAGEMQKTVIVVPGPDIGQLQDMAVCDTGDGTAIFNLSSQDIQVLNGGNPDDFFITYHLSAEDAVTGGNALPSEYTNTTNPQTIYARLASTAPDGCYATAAFQLETVKPEITMPGSYGLCEGGSLTLDAPEGFDGYQWSTGESTRSIMVTQTGSYTLTVYEALGNQFCEATQTITVYRSQAPVIKQIVVNDWTDNRNMLAVIAEGTGSYEYSLDGLHFQDNPEFTGLESGLYRIHVRDKNGCGDASAETVLLMHPRFFTPNSDGINDTWRIPLSYYEPDMEIRIFDRYGKVLYDDIGSAIGWDGKFNGRDLPSTDYWFVVTRRDRREYRGHFSLLR